MADRSGVEVAVAVLAGIGALLLATMAVSELARRAHVAFTLSTLAIVLLFVTLFVDLFPNVMPSSTDPRFNLTIANTSSSDTTLTLMAIVAADYGPDRARLHLLGLLGVPQARLRRRLRPGDEEPDRPDARQRAGRPGRRAVAGRLTVAVSAGERGARVDRRLLREARAARVPLVVAIVLGVLTAGLVVAQAILLGRIVARAFPGGESLDDVQGPLVALACVIAARAVCSAGFEASGRLGASRVMSELRERLTLHVLRARPSGLREQRTGDLVTTAVQGVDALEAYFARYLPQVVLAVLVPIVILVYVFPRDLAAGLILLVTVPLIPMFMILIGLAAQSATQKRWETLTLLSSHFLDVVRGLETLRANDRDAAQVTTLTEAGDAYRRQTMATLRIAFLSALVLELLAMLGTALVAATVAVQLIDGNITFAVGLSVLLLAPELYLPVRMVGQHFHASTDGLEAAGRLFAALDTPAAVSAPADPLPAPDVRTGAIELEDVRVAYPGRGEPVLDGLHLRIEPGELVALVGASGEGKSTLAALLLRLLDPDAGAVAVPRGGPARDRPAGVAPAARLGPAAARRCSAARSPTTSASASPTHRTTRSCARSRTPGSPTSSPGCPTASRRASARAAARCRPARRSASAWPARSCATRRCSCSTSPRRTWTRRRPPTSARRWSAWPRAARRILIAHDAALARRADRVLRLAGGVLHPAAVGAPS